MEDVKTAAQYLPTTNNLVFYVEGLGKTFPMAMYRAAGLLTQYKVNVIMFDYPTLNESQGVIKNFRFAESSSEASANSFSKFLSEMQQEEIDGMNWIANKNKILLMHSMGNVMMKVALQKKLMGDLKKDFLNRILFNAPCLSQNNHANWMCSINFSKEIYVHFNKRDFQLKGAYLMKRKSILGAVVKKPLCKNVFYINLRPVLKNKHNGYLNNPGISVVPPESEFYYFNLFHGKEMELNSLKYFKKNKAATMYTLKRADNSERLKEFLKKP